MSFWSWSSERAAKIPVSAEPGFVKRYSTPASFRVWMSSMPPVPVMVLRMSVPLSRISSAGSASRQLRARRLERLARDLVGRPRPRRRIRRLVAHEPVIALPVQEPEDFLEGYASAAGREPIERLAGLEPGARNVAVLDVRDLAERDVVDRGQGGAAPPEVVRVEQEPAARVRGPVHDPAHHVEVVELLGLRVELDRELHAVRG